MKKAALLPLVAALAIAFPAGAGADVFNGIVIAKQKNRHALVVASRTGAVHTVRTKRMGIRVGARVRVTGTALRDGTYRASQLSVRGRAHRARVRGVVVRNLRSRYLVSAGHSVFAIHTGRRLAAAGGGNPRQPGDQIDATVTVAANGELDEDEAEEVGHADKIELEGKVVSVTAPTAGSPGSIKVQVGGLTFDVVVPAGFTLPTLNPGDRVELKATVEGTTLTLVKVEQEDQDENDDQNENDDEDDGGGGDD